VNHFRGSAVNWIYKVGVYIGLCNYSDIMSLMVYFDTSNRFLTDIWVMGRLCTQAYANEYHYFLEYKVSSMLAYILLSPVTYFQSNAESID